MSKSLKSILVESGRYENIVTMLTNIIADTKASYPLRSAFVDNDGETSWRVDGVAVRQQANTLLKLIEADCDGNSSDDFCELRAYVKDKSDTLLHNYAVALSHNSQPKTDIDVIRQWEILDNMIACWNTNDEYDWYIPTDWQKTA